MLETVMTVVGGALAAETPLAASQAFHHAIAPLGVTYLQSRSYRRPRAPLTSATHWAAGGFVARYCRPGWPSSAAFNYVCFGHNPQLEPIRRGMTRSKSPMRFA